jgi:hypothetical protein
LTSPQIISPPSPEYALRIKDTFSSGWERWYWLQGDAHEDAPDYLENLHQKHLKDVVARQALIIDVGDMFDVVNGRDDKRRSKSGTKPKLNKDNYLDEVVEDTAERHKPHADLFVYLGRGNHDLKVLKMCETDILRRVADKLNGWRNPKLPPIHVGGYGGWIRFEFETGKGSNCQSFSCKLFHGSGGGGKVTKGVIQTNRRNAECDADIFVTGHIHEKWELNTLKEGLTAAGRVKVRESTHIQLGSYKLVFTPDGAGTWHTQREGGPKPIGGMFLRFYSPDGHKVFWETRKPHIDYDQLF